MKVIRDEELGGIATIPLIVDWGIPRVCEILDCGDATTTIIVFDGSENPTGKSLHVGICDRHHAEAAETGKFHYTLKAK